ncbi:MAG: glycoside hydrolase [Clostridiales bacterium]|nr:glycoside hydrolase [Clostridiales bacterium]
MSGFLVNGYVYPWVDPAILKESRSSLTFVSLFTYGVTSEGELIPLEDESLLEELRVLGDGFYAIAPLMVVAAMGPDGNFDSGLGHRVVSDPMASQRLSLAISEACRAKDLAGVDFDFEYLPPEDGEAYAALIRQTRDLLAPEGRIVTVAAAPKTYGEQPGLLYEAHDYPLLGQAADFVLLMTYEWGYSYGPPMAVSPIGSVRRVLDYGITAIPPEKILMGMSNYGYDWTLPYEENLPAEKLFNEEAQARAAYYGVSVQYDEEAQAPFYHYTDEQGREHVVWFEDRRSWDARLALVSEYGLAGISIWNLMALPPLQPV